MISIASLEICIRIIESRIGFQIVSTRPHCLAHSAPFHLEKFPFSCLMKYITWFAEPIKRCWSNRIWKDSPSFLDFSDKEVISSAVSVLASLISFWILIRARPVCPASLTKREFWSFLVCSTSECIMVSEMRTSTFPSIILIAVKSSGLVRRICSHSFFKSSQ